LRQLLKLMLSSDEGIHAQSLVDGWLDNEPKSRAEIMELLARHSLDLSAIEHEAINLAGPELESLNKMLATERSRFDKTVKRAEDLDQSFAEQLERSGNNILEDNDDMRTSSPDDEPGIPLFQ
jgi:Rad3-related DNA helicase